MLWLWVLLRNLCFSKSLLDHVYAQLFLGDMANSVAHQLAKLPVANSSWLTKNRDSLRMRLRRTIEKPLRNIESRWNLVPHESHQQKSAHRHRIAHAPKTASYCSLPLTFAATFTGTLYIRAGIHGCTGTPPAMRDRISPPKKIYGCAGSTRSIHRAAFADP